MGGQTTTAMHASTGKTVATGGIIETQTPPKGQIPREWPNQGIRKFFEKRPQIRRGGGASAAPTFLLVSVHNTKNTSLFAEHLERRAHQQTSARCSRKRSFVKQNKTQRHTFCVSRTMLKRNDFFRKKSTSLKDASWACGGEAHRRCRAPSGHLQQFRLSQNLYPDGARQPWCASPPRAQERRGVSGCAELLVSGKPTWDISIQNFPSFVPGFYSDLRRLGTVDFFELGRPKSGT